MGGAPIDRLTDGQRECLRLVLLHNSSKTIAQKLGISPHTVDQRLKVAMRTIGAASRVEAAQILAAAERGEGYQALVYQTPDIAARSPSPALSPAFETGTQRRAATDGNGVAEEQVPYQAEPPRTDVVERLQLPIRWGKRNDLTKTRRLLWIVLLPMVVGVGFLVVLTCLAVLAQLAWGIKSHFM